MSPFIDGLGWGMVLCFLIGPIFFALIQAGIEQGFRAGVAIGLGVWISDFLYIAAVYWGVSYVMAWVEVDGFKFYLGLIGGVLLIAFGVGTLISRVPDPPVLAGSTAKKKEPYRYSSYPTLLLKGFLINTINPFTVFFWLSIMSTVIVKGDLGTSDALLFFLGLFLTIVATDLAKVYLAKVIRHWLKPKYVLWVRRFSGIALIVFGIILIFRVSIAM
ncbi:MAG: LysE family translocator [Saprospiraceae bacterium]